MEYEVKILEIIPKQIRKKLLSIGCKKVHNQKIMKRTIYNLCDKSIDGFARVRDEGNKVTMTNKIFKNKDFPQENEISINEDFETACVFMDNLGLEKKSYQQTIREKWSHPLAHEITIDDIPGIPTYMEIDCTSKENLDKLIKLLDIDENKIRTGTYDKQFDEYYGISKNEFIKIPYITFNNIKKEVTPKKNIELFNKVVSKYTNSFLKKTKNNIKKNTIKITKKKCAKGTRKKCIKKN